MQIYSASQPNDEHSENPELLNKFSVRSAISLDGVLQERFIAFLTPDEVSKYNEILRFPDYAIRECTNHVIQSPKIEELDDLIYGVLNQISDKEIGLVPKEMAFFLTPAGLVIVAEPGALIDKVRQAIVMERTEKHMLTILPERALFLLMEKIVSADMALIRDLDETETILEEKLLAGEKMEYRQLIFRLRQKTLFLAQYAGLMADLADVLEDNENSQLTVEASRMFHLIHTRIDRLERSAATLREGVMQLREAYQSQTDNDANQLMKLFAVVSAIFLPLTFITGWYGMNFQKMPELSWKYGYFVLFLAVAAIMTGIILLFKKKHFL